MAAISSKVDAKAKLPTHYLLKSENGLELPSLVLMEQLRTIDKRRLETYIGHLEEQHIRRINRALAISVGLIEETPKNLRQHRTDMEQRRHENLGGNERMRKWSRQPTIS